MKASMGSVDGWIWTALILAVMLLIPARMFQAMLLAVVAMIVLPVALGMLLL